MFVTFDGQELSGYLFSDVLDEVFVEVWLLALGSAMTVSRFRSISSISRCSKPAVPVTRCPGQQPRSCVLWQGARTLSCLATWPLRSPSRLRKRRPLLLPREPDR